MLLMPAMSAKLSQPMGLGAAAPTPARSGPATLGRLVDARTSVAGRLCSRMRSRMQDEQAPAPGRLDDCLG